MRVVILHHLVSFLLQTSAATLGNLKETNPLSSSSPWLKRVAGEKTQREAGCWTRPWACGTSESDENRRQCCRNRCVEVTSDVNNCGSCGIRCRFPLQCCQGACVNTNVDPLHCGGCGKTCPLLLLCAYGMCGYAQQPPPPVTPPPPLPPPPPHPPCPYPPEPPCHLPPLPPRPPCLFPPFPYPPLRPHCPPRGHDPPPRQQVQEL